MNNIKLMNGTKHVDCLKKKKSKLMKDTYKGKKNGRMVQREKGKAHGVLLGLDSKPFLFYFFPLFQSWSVKKPCNWSPLPPFFFGVSWRFSCDVNF